MTAPYAIKGAASAAPDSLRWGEDMDPAEFAAIVSRLGVSDYKLARLIGVNRSTVSRWRAGKHQIPNTAAILLRIMATERS